MDQIQGSQQLTLPGALKRFCWRRARRVFNTGILPVHAFKKHGADRLAATVCRSDSQAVVLYS